MGFIRYIFLLILPVILLTEEVSSQSLPPAGNGKVNSSTLKLVSDNDEGLILSYNSPNTEFEKINRAEGNFIRLRLPDHSFGAEPGKPQLPVLTRLIDYEKARNASIIISDVHTVRRSLEEFGEYNLIYPSQPGQTKSMQKQEDPFAMDKSVYNAKHAYLTDTVTITRIGKMRGRTIASIEINPVIYNPSGKYVDIICSMNIHIRYSPGAGMQTEIKGTEDYYFNDLFSKGLINYEADDIIPGFSLEPSGMIIVSDKALKKHLKPLVEWKTKKGFRVTELYIGENGIERDFLDIKDSLNYIYNNSSPENPAPAFLLIAGDLNYVPASQGTNYLTDMYYAEFDGDGDFIPDMFTGRLPAKDTIQLKAMVRKIIQYESFAFADTVDHYRKAMAFTGFDEGYVSYMDGHVSYAAGYFNENPYPTESYIFKHEMSDSIRNVRYDSVKVLMNKGLGFINYTGHGSATSWLETGINNTFAAAMTNNSRYPLVISNACLTAKFNDNNCIGSAMVRAVDKGALAFIGCTNDSYWAEDYYWSIGAGAFVDNPSYEETGLGFYDRLFHLNGEKPSDWYTTTGQIVYGGNLGVSASTSPRKQYYWETYVLLGDPSISPYIGNPEILDDPLPDKIPPALKKLNISTSPFAYLGLSHADTLWDATHATPSGTAYLDIPSTEKDSCVLVISRQNAVPLIKTLYFEESDTAWLSINDAVITDLSGNDNGKADYNENISLKIDLQNAGMEDADNVYLKISSSSGYLTIINDSLYAGSIEAYSETLKEGFDISVSDSLPDLHTASIDIELHYNANIVKRTADFSLHAPELMILNCLVDDTLSGNGNGLPEAGERIQLIFRVANNGSSACSGILSINYIPGYIDFDERTLASGSLKPGEIVNIPVYANIEAGTPESTRISFDVELSCLPYVTTKTLSIIAGKTTEDFELLNFITFPWINESQKPWIISDETSVSNMYSARSGQIGHNEKTELAMLLNLAEDDTLRFWYRVSSEKDWDSLSFFVNNRVMISASGEIDWREAVIPLDKGVHSLQWIYEKDGSVNNGSDCAWIDLVHFPSLSFIQSAVHLNKISSPVEGKNYSNETISVELSNLGRDTIYEISMSYIVNGNPAVNETFSSDFKPGDTISLSFSETIDMTEINVYRIRVFATSPVNHFINDTLSLTLINTDIDEGNPDNGSFTVAPNPVRDNIRIISNIDSEANDIKLYNSSGLLVYNEKIESIFSSEQIYLDHGKISRGTYILVISNSKKRFYYKIIKL
ncbi:MAG: C25 family cysteine peptidase [Bacteroidales bacterium]|nr:C25 family cysteine peptidase [Bacteroidales bacterium]